MRVSHKVQPVFRFAPSPNGFLHLGHAYSALLNAQLARERGGRFLLRIEDIDTVRCREELVTATLEDLAWLGLEWEQPVLRQSRQFPRYQAVLADLEAAGVVYPCFCSRKAIGAAATGHDPDGAPLYSGACRSIGASERADRRAAGHSHSLRLDLAEVLHRLGHPALDWQDEGRGRVAAQPGVWGDVIIGRKETPTSYHLAVVMDDAHQGVTDVVRGADLFAATAIHRVLQALLGLPEPRYRHHALLTDESGQKLAKSRMSTALRQLRAEGIDPADLRHRLGFPGL